MCLGRRWRSRPSLCASCSGVKTLRALPAQLSTAAATQRLEVAQVVGMLSSAPAKIAFLSGCVKGRDAASAAPAKTSPSDRSACTCLCWLAVSDFRFALRLRLHAGKDTFSQGEFCGKVPHSFRKGKLRKGEARLARRSLSALCRDNCLS